MNYLQKEKVVTSSEIAKVLKVSWNTAESDLKELLIEGKIERIKKEGVTLWLKK
jgi:Mn-dependent DtxR family transcriptional regulator